LYAYSCPDDVVAYDDPVDPVQAVHAAWDAHKVRLDDLEAGGLACAVHQVVDPEAGPEVAGADRDYAARAQGFARVAPWGWGPVVAASDCSPARARPFSLRFVCIRFALDSL